MSWDPLWNPAAMTESSTLPGPVIIIIIRTNNNKKIRRITVATRILIKNRHHISKSGLLQLLGIGETEPKRFLVLAGL